MAAWQSNPMSPCDRLPSVLTAQSAFWLSRQRAKGSLLAVAAAMVQSRQGRRQGRRHLVQPLRMRITTQELTKQWKAGVLFTLQRCRQHQKAHLPDPFPDLALHFLPTVFEQPSKTKPWFASMSLKRHSHLQSRRNCFGT